VNLHIQNKQTRQKLSEKLKCTFTLCVLVTSTVSLVPAVAATYYVNGVSGSDSSPGSSAMPLKTIQKAAYIVRPGDTVIVKNGTYTTTGSTLVVVNYGGSLGKPVTFKAENPSGAKLDGRNNQTKHAWSIEPGVGYVNVQGFEMFNYRSMAVNVGGQVNNMGITGNYIHHIGRECTNSGVGNVGIFLRKSSSITIANNIIHDIGRYAPGENGCQPSNAYYQNHDHGIYLDGVNNITINDNKFFNEKRGWGIQVYSGAGNLSTGIKILNNDFSYSNPYRDGHIVFSNPGITRSSVANNKFHQPRGQALNIVSGITLSGVSVSNNTTYSATISKVSPSGVTFSGNMVVK
jgi:hypothetical protein